MRLRVLYQRRRFAAVVPPRNWLRGTQAPPPPVAAPRRPVRRRRRTRCQRSALLSGLDACGAHVRSEPARDVSVQHVNNTRPHRARGPRAARPGVAQRGDSPTWEFLRPRRAEIPGGLASRGLSSAIISRAARPTPESGVPLSAAAAETLPSDSSAAATA